LRSPCASLDARVAPGQSNGQYAAFCDAVVLIGFVLAFIIGPWRLTFGQSAVVLLSSGIGAILGAFGWGWIADRIGRRKVFILTVLNFSLATGTLYFTPDNDWVYLSVARFFVGLGVGGLYCVDLPLVQEFMPSAKRGWVSGLVTCVIPLGVGIGAVLGAYATPTIGWRGLFALGVLPALLALLVRVWVPESSRWLLRQGRTEEARESLAWAMQVNPQSLPLPTAERQPEAKTNWCSDIRAALRCHGSAMPARRLKSMASCCGRRRFSWCCSRSRRRKHRR
jgi:MFS transporter, putative metabolite:H+ symporter